MSSRPYATATLLAALSLLPAAPAFADGEIQITHAKALAGNVTPGDAAGYPVTISIPGTFQLASNLFVAANKIGIQVISQDVTIDLNGFKLEGSDVAWYGITGSVDAVTIENGTITRFKFDGINGGTGNYWIVNNLRSIENGRDGINISTASQIRNSTVAANGDEGIVCGEGCLVEGNVVQQNGDYGVSIYSGVVLGNTIVGNADYGIISAAGAGFGNNMLTQNNGNMTQKFFVAPLHPNICIDAVC
jgi:hypothetical protein